MQAAQRIQTSEFVLGELFFSNAMIHLIYYQGSPSV
jgi:hypothetical protein